MTRPATTPRPTLRLLGLAGLVALAACAGCHGRSTPAAGGANNRKAREGREAAQELALAGVKGAADAQVAAHPGLEKKGMGARIKELVVSHLPGGPAPVSAPAPAPPPPAPPAPAPAPPPVRASAVVVVSAAKSPAPADEAKPSGAVVIREKVASGIPYPTEAEADDDAVERAAEKIEERLRALDPPVLFRPTPGVVRNEYLRRRSREVRDPNEFERAALEKSGYGEGRKYVEYTVEVTADQVRELRTRARVGSALRVLGAVAGVALAGFLFLRLDEWTRGYLTSWLAFAAVALAGGVAAALVLV